MTEEDVLFVSSPQTFDPFMIDISLAICNGASLLMTNFNMRYEPNKLLDILFSPEMKAANVSVMQITPSLFMRWTLNDIQHRIFSKASRLRILAFGGEPFPATTTLCKWTNWENEEHSMRIFNLYGLTEMSCWATIYEITKDDILCHRKIPIGRPIDSYTKFHINADGELILRSTVRKCFQTQFSVEQVCANDFEMVLHTGDLVSIESGLYYFQARVNSAIKFFGNKINLAEIESRTKCVHHVDEAVCLFNQNLNLITLFVKVDENFEDVKRKIIEAIRMIGVRVKIISVTEYPLTKHGKICKSELLSMDTNDKQSQSIESTLQELINETFGTTIQFSDVVESFDDRKKKFKDTGYSSFIHLGGNSLKAIQIVDEFERVTKHSMPFLLTMLLNEKISINEILARVANDKTRIETAVTRTTDEIREIIPRWKVDMEKCIDATPSVCLLNGNEAIVSVGSHSKLLYNISVKSGECISKLELPDRIESQIIQMGEFGFVGCYDGCMYCFKIRTGSIKWKFNTGEMIKCRALLLNRTLLFGNYSETTNFWCLDANNGNLIWSQKIGSKSIYANPIEVGNGNVLVCSLDGTVAWMNSHSAKVVWSFQLQAPVFSTPTVYHNKNRELQIIVLAVNGHMYGLNSDGVPLWNQLIDGNIFASSIHFVSSANSECVNILFGSRNRNLYCHQINTSNGVTECTEVWKFTTTASIRSNPILVNSNHKCYVIVFSSDGMVSILDSVNGQSISQTKISGEIFSSPVIHNGNLFIGSRNNFLYCFGLNDLIRFD